MITIPLLERYLKELHQERFKHVMEELVLKTDKESLLPYATKFLTINPSTFFEEAPLAAQKLFVGHENNQELLQTFFKKSEFLYKNLRMPSDLTQKDIVELNAFTDRADSSQIILKSMENFEQRISYAEIPHMDYVVGKLTHFFFTRLTGFEHLEILSSLVAETSEMVLALSIHPFLFAILDKPVFFVVMFPLLVEGNFSRLIKEVVFSYTQLFKDIVFKPEPVILPFPSFSNGLPICPLYSQVQAINNFSLTPVPTINNSSSTPNLGRIETNFVESYRVRPIFLGAAAISVSAIIFKVPNLAHPISIGPLISFFKGLSLPGESLTPFMTGIMIKKTFLGFFNRLTGSPS